ncbi:hypothetical protein AS589_01035 [Empedobacter brevis]|nr:hypothetical protein AS589_01035 [Empedobacter brevis]
MTIFSCTDDDHEVRLDEANFVKPELTLPNNGTVILAEETADSTINFQWSEADYGQNVVPKYALEAAVSNTNFAEPIIVASTFETSHSITQKDLNILAESLGLEPQKEGTIDIRVTAILGTQNSLPLISETKSLKLTPYPTDLSTNWGIVGSATPNQWDGPDIPFWKTETPNVFVAYADLIDGEIKFRQDNKWDLDYGDNDPVDGKLDKGGKNISVKAGSYKVTINLNDLTYKIEPYTWGLVGDATPNGWEGPDVKLAYDGMEDAWSTIVTMKDGEFKFRLNNKWDVSYGGTDTPNVLTDENGANIKIKAGTYKVTANFNKKTYSVEAQ